MNKTKMFIENDGTISFNKAIMAILMTAAIFAIAGVGVTNANAQTTYQNYNSTKYQIAFDYPSEWTFEEKTNRFEVAPEISIADYTGNALGIITVGYTERQDFMEYLGGTNVVSATNNAYDGLMNSYDYPTEYTSIESPSFDTIIDGQKAGTFVYTMEDKSETSSMVASQTWTIIVGDHGYFITFGGLTDTFDSPEAIEIRDHFINSIKFLDTGDIDNNTSDNETSRFA
jgi:hypothetical protein